MPEAGYQELIQQASDDIPPRHSSASDDLPVVQFSCPSYIVKEGEQSEARLEVYRIGTHAQLAKRSEVAYQTMDDSATDGRQYEAKSGTIAFESGDVSKMVTIKLLNNEVWDPTTQFRVTLLAEGLIDAVLGRFLFECRVKIVDNNYFPTEEYKGFKGQDPEDKRSPLAFRLPLRYFSMNFNNSSKVARGTIKHILVDVVHNLWYLISLFMGVYLLDFVVDKEAPASQLILVHDKKIQLLLFVGVNLLALFILHFLDYAKLSFGIGGTSRAFMECALVRKYLNYTTIVRGEMDSGALVMAIHRDVSMCVSSYFQILKLFSVFGQLAMMLTFKVLCCFLFGAKLDIRSFSGPLIYPVILSVFLQCRAHKTMTVLEDRNDAQDEVTGSVEETTANNAIIMDHSLRNYVSTRFSDVVKKYNTKGKVAGQVLENNYYFARWSGTLIVGSYIYFGGEMLLAGMVTTGMFVTNLKVVEAWCKSFEQIYEIIVHITTTVPHFCALTHLVNLQTDMADRKAVLDGQMKHSELTRAEIRKNLGPNDIGVDMMPIICKLDTVLISDWKNEARITFNMNLSIRQGGLVFVAGGKGSGKATFLRLLAGRYLPRLTEKETLFVPGHLRVLTAQEHPIFFKTSLYENLIYGMKASSPAASRERVMAICGLLGVLERAKPYLSQDAHEDWYATFSAVECKLLGIARALVNNFEITCFHKPTTGVTAADRTRVFDTITKHCQERGLVPSTDLSVIQKRARTVFVSTQQINAQVAHYSQDIISLKKEGSVYMTPEEIEEVVQAEEHHHDESPIKR